MRGDELVTAMNGRAAGGSPEERPVDREAQLEGVPPFRCHLGRPGGLNEVARPFPNKHRQFHVLTAWSCGWVAARRFLVG